MSLSGLDSPAVQEAYQTAVVEVGGWFLLRYTSRDEVELLDHGKNGVAEARSAIQAYTEPSPLYGLIIYRRRKVIIKFVPDSTSRLLKARTAVHFLDVTERYAPYETLLEISSAEALNDTSLAASFPLHTASPSPANSSRLHEISEDGEDHGASPKRSSNSNKHSSSGHTFASQRLRLDRRLEQLARAERADRPPPSIQITDDSTPPSSPRSTLNKPSISQYLVRDDSGRTSITPLDSSPSLTPATEYDGSDLASKAVGPATSNEESRTRPYASETIDRSVEDEAAPVVPPKSTERVFQRDRDLPPIEPERPLPVRPLNSDEETAKLLELAALDGEPFDFSQFDALLKPKVKLGPRPAENPKRHITASIAAVPASYKAHVMNRPKSAGRGSATPAGLTAFAPVIPAPPPIPDTPEYNPRPVSRGSIKSLPSHKSTGMTSDKMRLMKAVELRKKQLRKSNTQDQASKSSQGEGPLKVPKVPEVPQRSAVRSMAKTTESELAAKRIDRLQSNKSDSGIGLQQDQTSMKDKEPESVEQPSRDQPLPSPHHSFPARASSNPRALEVPTDPHYTGMIQEPIKDITAKDTALSPTISGARNPQTDSGNADEFYAAVPTLVMADGSRIDKAGERPPRNASRPLTAIRTDAVLHESSSDSEREANVPAAPLASAGEPASVMAKRRRGFVEPLQLDLTSGNPDDFLSDDDFLDELHSATLQEARPVTTVTVMRSPASAYFQGRRPSAQSTRSDTENFVNAVSFKRTSSMPIDKFYEDQPTERFSREAYNSPKSATDRAETLSGLNRLSSSGLSKRVQELAESSTWEHHSPNSNVPPRSLTPDPSIANASQQDQRDRRSFINKGPRPISFRKRNSYRLSGSQVPGSSSNLENNAVLNVQHDAATNRNSVSVTARIVRPNASSEADQSDGHLQQSELTVNHQRQSTILPSRIELPPLNTNTSYEPQNNVSPAHARESMDVRNMHSGSRFGRHKPLQYPQSPTPDDFPPPPTNRAPSRTSFAVSDDSAPSKEGSRTSRFFKRMSNLGTAVGNKRRSSTQQSLTSNKSISEALGLSGRNANRMSIADTPPAVLVGDLNVQFPDSLLWKRRIVTIDEAGNLQFAIAQAMDIHKSAATKKYHFSQLKLPYAPDVDSQELPHSVVVELNDGTTLQAACEDAMTHRQVLHMLRMYWKAWSGLPG